MRHIESMTKAYSSPEEVLDRWNLAAERERQSNMAGLFHNHLCQVDPVMAKYDGFTGEWAVTDDLGLPRSRRVEGSADPGWDLEYRGLKGSVKYTKYASGRLVECVDYKPLKWDFAVLVVRGDAPDHVIVSRGIWYAGYLEYRYKDNLGFGDRWVVEPGDMTLWQDFRRELETA